MAVEVEDRGACLSLSKRDFSDDLWDAEVRVPLMTSGSCDHANREGVLLLLGISKGNCGTERRRRGSGVRREEIFASVRHLSAQFEKSDSASLIEGKNMTGVLLPILHDHDGFQSLDQIGRRADCAGRVDKKSASIEFATGI